MSERVVALVPMRHRSERVPGKNYRTFNGRPLFHHILSTLQRVRQIQTIVVDTDSPLIVEQCGTSFPDVVCVERPTHLLGGDVAMTEIVRHDASIVESDWYLQTHSTNPLLRSETVEKAISLLFADLARYDSLFSVTRLQTRLYGADGGALNHDPAQLLRTQDLPPVFEENSNLYLFPSELAHAGRRIGDRPLMFEMDPLEAVDIDEEHDFVIAEMLHGRATVER